MLTVCRSDLEDITEIPLKKCTLCCFNNGSTLFAAAGAGNIITVWKGVSNQVLATFKVNLASARKAYTKSLSTHIFFAIVFSGF